MGAASLDLAGDEATLRMLDALGLRGLIRLRDGLLHVRVPLGGVRPLRPGPGAETASALASQQGPDHSRAGRPRAV